MNFSEATFILHKNSLIVKYLALISVALNPVVFFLLTGLDKKRVTESISDSRI